MVKLDVTCMRHLSKHDIRVLTAVEVSVPALNADSRCHPMISMNSRGIRTLSGLYS